MIIPITFDDQDVEMGEEGIIFSPVVNKKKRGKINTKLV